MTVPINKSLQALAVELPKEVIVENSDSKVEHIVLKLIEEVVRERLFPSLKDDKKTFMDNCEVK